MITSEDVVNIYESKQMSTILWFGGCDRCKPQTFERSVVAQAQRRERQIEASLPLLLGN